MAIVRMDMGKITIGYKCCVMWNWPLIYTCPYKNINRFSKVLRYEISYTL